MKRLLISAVVFAVAMAAPLAVASSPIPPAPPVDLVREIAATRFEAATGRDGARGREVDHRRDRAGYALVRPLDPLLLEPGHYRASFILRRGDYPAQGFLEDTFPVFRVELFDATDGSVVLRREVQVCELPRANFYEPVWLEFSMDARAGHVIEPRVFWPGFVNGEIESVRIERLPVDTPARLQEKARAIADRLQRNHLENGFVVSRKPNGEPDEVEDAVTYTSLYAASLAWELSQTHDALTAQALENAMAALHNAIKGTPDDPIITRFVDSSGTPAAKSPSKDVYCSFFFACSMAYPVIENESLRRQIRSDVNRIAARLLRDDLTIRGGPTMLVNLAPYFKPAEVRNGIHELADRGRAKKTLKALQQARRYVPFQELWPGMNELMAALEKRNEDRLYALVVPTMNGVVVLAERVLQLLKEQSRDDLLRFHGPAVERPGRQLARTLGESLRKLPPARGGRRFQNLSDLRILASNALITLHIIKTAAVITGSSQFTQYYKENLYSQDALLQTALDWYAIEDQLMRVTVGNAEAARDRRGYLSLLAAFNLFQLERNPNVRAAYRTLLEREEVMAQSDDNPLVCAVAREAGIPTEMAPVWRALSLYPEDPVGFGDSFWRENGRRVAQLFGGGESEDFAREPLPVSVRPRDSFLWQRNSRRLRGDSANRYPGTDYLFLYWFARKGGLIPAPPPEATVRAVVETAPRPAAHPLPSQRDR